MSSGPGYGIRISKADRNRYFVPGWDRVELEFPSGQRVKVSLTRSFWKPEKACAELRSAAVGRWMIEQGVAPWPKGLSATADVGAIGSDVFRRHVIRLSTYIEATAAPTTGTKLGTRQP
jgi:hypothetical protein